MGHKGMGMRHEQGMRQSMEMGLKISLDDITRIIAETSPLRQVKVNEGDIRTYLINVNGFLAEQKIPPEELRSNYLTALAIYTFAAPVMGMDIDKGVQSSFAGWARRRYDIADPFNVYFLPVVIDNPEESGVQDVTDEVRQGCVDVGGSVKSKLFKATKHVQSGIGDIVLDAHSKLRQHGHSRSRHYRFTGAYEVCVPLFGADVENNDLRQTHAQLRDEHGYFQLQGPE